jgi:hypothetical protein
MILSDKLGAFVKEHDYSPPLGSCYFPTFDEEGLRGFGLNFFR